MPWKTRLLLAVLALGTVAGYGSAIARARHCHVGHSAWDKSSCACAHGAVDKPAATP